MPYKMEGTSVFVLKDGKWILLKKHKTKEEALKHIRALHINVREAHKRN